MYDKAPIKYFMKNILKIIIVIFLPLFLNAKDEDLIKIRQLYYKASANRADAETFFKVMHATSNIDPSLTNGFKGMSYMIKANFDFNPYYKLSYFVKGKGLLDGAIDGDPKNVELRFLRFCVQTNAPGFLGYSGKIAVDKKVILDNYKTISDLDLKSRIKGYMLNSKSCSKEEKLIFKG